MTKSNFFLSAALAAVTIAGPLSASAALLGGSSSVNGASAVTASVNSAATTVTNTSVTTSTTGASNPNTSGSLTGGVQTGADVSGNSNINAGLNSDTNVNPSVGSQVYDSLKADAHGMLNFSRADFDDASKDAAYAQASIKTASNVSTQADLQSFARGSFQNDENLKSMSFGSDKVEVGYAQHGHFLGFIPVTENVKTSVAADGTVSTNYPWYTFLVASDRADLEAAVSARIQSYLKTRGNAQAALSARDQATIAAQIYSVMKARYEGSNNATSTVSGSYNS